MDVHPALQIEPLAERVALPAALAKRLLAEDGAWMKALRQAVLPFHFAAAAADNGVALRGDRAALMLVEEILKETAAELQRDGDISPERANAVIAEVKDKMMQREFSFRFDGIASALRPASFAQIAFLRLLLAHSDKLLIGVGPTGAGKTYLALAAGVTLLAQQRIKHLVVTRPFTPMDGETTTPFPPERRTDQQFIAVEDALDELIGYNACQELIEHRKLEITPLGRLRGRTLNHAMVVIDDAQNMTVQKMRMAATRLGTGSRMAIIGDPTHVDLGADEPSGLKHLICLVQKTDIADIFRFAAGDIIRNRTVAQLERLYAGDAQGGADEAAA